MSKPSITVSLEKAKELKEAGWPQGTSCFVVYTISCISASASSRDYFALQDDDLGLLEVDELYDAPTAEEIINKLPTIVPSKEFKNSCSLSIPINEDRLYMVGYEPFKDYLEYMGKDLSLANAAASCYCQLSTNNLL